MNTNELSSAVLIVPTYNAGDDWVVWLEAYSAQNVKPAHTVVIDSSSDDKTRELAINEGLEVICISKDDFNHGGTRQYAVDRFQAFEYIIFMTQDAILAEPDALERLLYGLNDSDVFCTYGRQLPSKNANLYAAHARIFNYPDAPKKKKAADINTLGIKAAFCSNSFAAYRTSLLKKVGGFPSDVIFGEDMYVCAKAILAGASITYNHEALVHHSHNYTLIEEFKRYFDIGVFHASESELLSNFGSVNGEGMAFLKSEISFVKSKNKKLVPIVFIRTAAKYIGYKAGINFSVLPNSVRRRVSMSPRYWNDC